MTCNDIHFEALADVDSFTLKEFQYAIKDMKSNKAADQIGIIFEMIKFGSDELHHHILKFLNLILTKGQVPEEWSTIFFLINTKIGRPNQS